ncbi:hypothetical protein IJ101_02330 [Candidatus Saccharibacteria bacterium]|nr:hypothetical protein [Candidatus Saccharibacteria bacterium]
MNNGNKLKKNESLVFKKVLQKVGKVALATTALFGGVKTFEAASAMDRQIKSTEIANAMEEMMVDSIEIHGGPNLRSDPEIPDDLGDISINNIITDLGDKDQSLKLPYEGVVYTYEQRGDANGPWCGFPGKEFAKILYENGHIDEETRDKIAKQGIVWISDEYVSKHQSEAPDDGVNQQN